MNKQLNEQIQYWKITAGRSWETARSLFKLKHYDACLFFCHLVIEKILKGLVVKKTKQAVSYTHDLEKLVLLANLAVSKNKLVA
ncbi:MAG: HEPN domain-containing protein [Patescibacteria group bacterium]